MRVLPLMMMSAALAAGGEVRAQATGGAASAPSGAAAPVVLPEVTVSATRTERDPMDLPVSIDSVDQRTIREANPQVNLSEVLGRVPGIAVQNRQNYAQDLQISSRGFGARASFGVRGIRLIADGIPATMPDGQGQAASFNLSSAQRIEVMRGPFSSLYGNAAGGVVQIFTADGPERPTLSGSLLGASYGTSRVGFQAGGQQGALNGIVDVSRFETDGYRANSWTRRDQANAKVKFDLGDAGVLTLVANTLDQPETRDPLGLTAAQAALNPRQAVAAAYQFGTRKSISQAQGGLTWDLPLSGGDTLHTRLYAGDRQVTQYLATPLAAQAAPTRPQVEHAPHARLQLLHREGRSGRDLGGQLHRGGEQITVLDHATHQAPTLGRGCVDDVAGEQHLGRPLATDQLREPTHAGHVAAQAAQHEQLAELGALRRDADVGHQRQLHAPADRRAVHCSDDGHVRVQQGIGRRGEPWRHRRGLRPGAPAHHLTHVVARAERRVGAGDDDAPRGRGADGSLELVVALEPQGIAHVGAIDRDHVDLTHATHVDVGHLAPPHLARRAKRPVL